MPEYDHSIPKASDVNSESPDELTVDGTLDVDRRPLLFLGRKRSRLVRPLDTHLLDETDRRTQLDVGGSVLRLLPVYEGKQSLYERDGGGTDAQHTADNRLCEIEALLRQFRAHESTCCVHDRVEQHRRCTYSLVRVVVGVEDVRTWAYSVLKSVDQLTNQEA